MKREQFEKEVADFLELCHQKLNLKVIGINWNFYKKSPIQRPPKPYAAPTVEDDMSQSHAFCLVVDSKDDLALYESGQYADATIDNLYDLLYNDGLHVSLGD